MRIEHNPELLPQALDHRIVSGDYIEVKLLIRDLMHDFSGKTIIELGPGSRGVDLLYVLSEEAYKVLGVDCTYDEFPSSSNPKVDLVGSRIESLKNFVDSEIADLVYFHNMHPEPWNLGPFTREEFDNALPDIVSHALKPEGYFFAHQSFPSYMPEERIFLNNGFNKVDIKRKYNSNVMVFRKTKE